MRGAVLRPHAPVWAALLAAGSLACPPREPPQPPPAPVPDEGVSALPDPVGAPTNKEAGEVLAITVPRVDGSGLDLRELRGKAVVVELTASWVDSWPGIFRDYDRLLAAPRGDLAVVLVVMDGERDALAEDPGMTNPGLVLAWDPQGAVAAQLQAAAIPTVLVLDRSGRIVAVLGGADARTPQRIGDALSSALASP